MDILKILRIVLLAVVWPILIGGSLYIDIKGRKVFQLVKGSLVGKISQALVFTMLVEMHSLGLLGTAYVYTDIRGVYVVAPIFLIWIITFVWALKILSLAQKEAEKLALNN